MDRWKSRGGKSQRGEAKNWEEQRRERVRRKKMQVREKVRKSRFTVFFPIIWGSGGSKSKLAKAAGGEPAGQMRDEKLHAVDTSPSDHFWKLRMSKKCTLLWREAHFQVKMYKTQGADHFLTFTVQGSKKWTPLWRFARSTFPSLKC